MVKVAKKGLIVHRGSEKQFEKRESKRREEVRKRQRDDERWKDGSTRSESKTWIISNTIQAVFHRYPTSISNLARMVFSNMSFYGRFSDK